jgi:hypothetical protein
MVAAAKKSPGGARATATKRKQEAAQDDSEGVYSETETEYGRKLRESAEADEAQSPTPEQTAQFNAEVVEELERVAFSDTAPKNIHDCIIALMKGIGVVRKNRRNTQGSGYNFRGVDDVVNAASPGLRALGVTIRPELVEKTHGWQEVGSNRSWMGWADVTMAYHLQAPDGSEYTWIAPGFAFDSGDKMQSKACSVAYRTAFLQGLCLPTDSRDPDHDTYHVSQPDDDATPVNAGRAAEARRAWEAQQAKETAQQAAQPQERPTQEERQAQAGEENQASEADIRAARTEMWRIAKGLGWEWPKLVSRFKSDYGCEPMQSEPKVLQGFTEILISEAQQEEDAAKALVQSELGGREVPPNEPPFPESTPGSERLI